MKKPNTEDIDVVILCGGRGERLRPLVNDRPKVMAKINNHPFLDILIDYTAGFGFKRFVFCTGYMAAFIERYYQKKETPLTFVFSEEKNPLGTAGAIKHAESFIKSDPFLVMNGDSICKIDLNRFLDFHISKKALISAILVNSQDTKDCGLVRLNDFQEIVEFNEKQMAGPQEFINAGIYLLAASILSMIPSNINFSLEYDLFPKIKEGFFGYSENCRLIDIGTPERYKEAKSILGATCEQKA